MRGREFQAGSRLFVFLMMAYKITALKIQKRNRQRVNVYLDGEFAFGLAHIVAAWLEVGQEISDEKIAQLKADDEREAAYQRAVNYLSYRLRTETEIRKNLRKHDVSEEVIENVIDRLQRSGLVDDARFALNWVENRSEMRPRGRRALSYELRQKGVNSKIIQQVVDSIDEDELAYQAASLRYRKLRNLEFQDFRKKMYSHLAQRGFNYESAAQAISRVWDEEHEYESPEEEEIL